MPSTPITTTATSARNSALTASSRRCTGWPATGNALNNSQSAPPPSGAAAAPKHEIASFDKLNPWYYSDAPKTVRPQLDLARRTSSFDEVQGGLDEGNALFEARRCLSCGNASNWHTIRGKADIV